MTAAQRAMARSLRRLDLPRDYHDFLFQCAELDAHNWFGVKNWGGGGSAALRLRAFA